jgi:hypothetical protein
MTYALAALVACGIALPHLVELRRAAPATAVALWASSLALRALTACFVVLYLVAFLPRTALFNAVTHWCWHTVLPLMATHLGLDGHRVGDWAAVLPSFVLAASVVSMVFGVTRAARSVRRLLDRHVVGVGPHDSVIVGGPDVMLAAAGLMRPRIVVSAGALTILDDEELAAGLEHERGHIHRRHRFLLVFAQLCRAVGRILPGGERAVAALDFHLERDADHYALRRHDRLALASAICKAGTGMPSSVALSTLSGAGTAERVRQLLDEPVAFPLRGRGALLGGLALCMVTLTVMLTALLPATALAGARQGPAADRVEHCQS